MFSRQITTYVSDNNSHTNARGGYWISIPSRRRDAVHITVCTVSRRRDAGGYWISILSRRRDAVDITMEIVMSTASARGSLIERGAGGEGRGRGAAGRSRRKIKKAERGKRVYREGHPLAGQAHASGRHAKRSRVGFDWKVDCEPPPPIGGSRLMWVDRISRKEIRLHPGDVLP